MSIMRERRCARLFSTKTWRRQNRPRWVGHVTVSPMSLEEIHHGAVHAGFTANRFKGRHLRKMHNFFGTTKLSNVTDLSKQTFKKMHLLRKEKQTLLSGWIPGVSMASFNSWTNGTMKWVLLTGSSLHHQPSSCFTIYLITFQNASTMATWRTWDVLRLCHHATQRCQITIDL